MGQYYKPIILKDDKKHIEGYVYTHEYGCGLKLMEHAYIDNPVCNVVENYLKEKGGARLVWAGDYADAEPVKIPKEQAKQMWLNMVANGKTETSFTEFWAKSPDVYKRNPNGELAGECLYSLADSQEDENGKTIRRAKPKIQASAERNNLRFLINRDKKQFVDLWDVPCIDGYRVNPLPLLTAEGNGRGGGDYSGINEKLVGSWARDFIIVKEHSWGALDDLKNHGFTLITPNFVETYAIKRELETISKLIDTAMEDLEIQSDPHFVGEIRQTAKDIIAKLPQKSREEARVMSTKQ